MIRHTLRTLLRPALSAIAARLRRRDTRRNVERACP